MANFESRRYGDLLKISAKTDGRCHICHGLADLRFYGPPGCFGNDTVTVDHLLPQAYGGDDDSANLRLAHASCNSSRGTRDAEDVRMELVGTRSEPFSTDAKNGITLIATGLGYVGGGKLFATRRPDGSEEFNHGAGLLAAFGLALLAHSLL